MSDLVEWLTNILDEDERTADLGHGLGSRSLEYFETDEYSGIEVNSTWLLADIAAKRAILALHAEVRSGEPRPNPWCDADERLWPCPTLVLLAAAYAGRPGYREEWRP